MLVIHFRTSMSENDCARRQPLAPVRPASVALRRHLASSMPAPHHSRKWLDGVSDALAYALRGYGILRTWRSTSTPSPLRPYARAYAYRGLRAFASLSMARSGSAQHVAGSPWIVQSRRIKTVAERKR